MLNSTPPDTIINPERESGNLYEIIVFKGNLFRYERIHAYAANVPEVLEVLEAVGIDVASKNDVLSSIKLIQFAE